VGGVETIGSRSKRGGATNQGRGKSEGKSEADSCVVTQQQGNKMNPIEVSQGNQPVNKGGGQTKGVCSVCGRRTGKVLGEKKMTANQVGSMKKRGWGEKLAIMSEI